MFWDVRCRNQWGEHLSNIAIRCAWVFFGGLLSVNWARGLALAESVWPLFSLQMHCCLHAPVLTGRRAKCVLRLKMYVCNPSDAQSRHAVSYNRTPLASNTPGWIKWSSSSEPANRAACFSRANVNHSVYFQHICVCAIFIEQITVLTVKVAASKGKSFFRCTISVTEFVLKC